MRKHYDVIVVGGGHNGLVAATYLAKEGKDVLVLERGEEVGGACVTQELFPGCKVSTYAQECSIFQDKIIDDLQLRKFGLEIIPTDPLLFHPFPDGSYLISWHDPQKTSDAIAKSSPQDARAYLEWHKFWKKAVEILHPFFFGKAPTLSQVYDQLSNDEERKIFNRLVKGNMLDLVTRFFKSPRVRAHFIEADDCGDPSLPGTPLSVAYKKCSMLTKRENFGIPKGGMGNITKALKKVADSFNVEISTGKVVEKILVEKGKAVGVALQGGETLSSEVVLSNADPKKTFLHLVDDKHLPPLFLSSIRQLKSEVSSFVFHALLKELPDFSAYLGEGFNPKLVAKMKICPTMDYYSQAWREAKKGRITLAPLMTLYIPTAYDPSLTPSGEHLLSAIVKYAPMPLRSRKWEEVRKDITIRTLVILEEYFPGFRKALRASQLLTPFQLSKDLSLTLGNFSHLDMLPSQMLADRPNFELSAGTTPIKDLHLCGAGSYPGGGVSGAPGYNAAQLLLSS